MEHERMQGAEREQKLQLELQGEGRIYYSAMDDSFRFHHIREERPNPSAHKQHYEQMFEVYLFLRGEGSYTIEGNSYKLEPYSLLVMNPNELHALSISGEVPYERIVLNISESFMPPFMSNGVDFFRAIKYRRLGHHNQIPTEAVVDSGLLGHFDQLQKHVAVPSSENELVAKCIIVQLLSLINRLATADRPSEHRGADYKMRRILEYINMNLDKELSLDALAERFFITKYYMCRSFKEATGYSINQYITYKRIHKADELMQEGHTPTKACFMSGFNSYSSFYRSYRKLTGQAPRRG